MTRKAFFARRLGGCVARGRPDAGTLRRHRPVAAPPHRIHPRASARSLTGGSNEDGSPDPAHARRRDEAADLILTGLQSDDLGFGQTGVVLAELKKLEEHAAELETEIRKILESRAGFTF